MTSLILAIALSLGPQQNLVEVEFCELNEATNFTQVILWRWMRLPTGSGHRVADWRRVKDPVDENFEVRWRSGRWWITATTSDDERLSFVSRSYSHTRTLVDPEVEDRKLLGQEQRKSYLK